MKARGVVVLVAFLLASTATAAVFMYVRGVKEEARTGGDRIEVIVAKRDIPAGSDMDTLIASGTFASRSIPEDTAVRGVVTSLSQLKGRRTLVPILAGEQIVTARLQGSTELPGGTIGIPPGYQAVAVMMEAPRVVGGAVTQGNHVSIYATFQDVTSLEVRGGSEVFAQQDITVALVPDVTILQVAEPGIDRTSNNIVVTMALKPRDAQKVVFAQENGTIWLSLLPPEETGVAQSPITIAQVVKT